MGQSSLVFAWSKNMLDGIMFSRGLRPFCRVCEAAVARTILYYSE